MALKRRRVITLAVVSLVGLGLIAAAVFVGVRVVAADHESATPSSSASGSGTSSPRAGDSASPLPSQTPDPPPAQVVMTAAQFTVYIAENVKAIDKDLNDLDTALSANNVLRIASNDAEIDYGVRQLEVPVAPTVIAPEWEGSVANLRVLVAQLGSEIEAQNYPGAQTTVADIRTELSTALALSHRVS